MTGTVAGLRLLLTDDVVTSGVWANQASARSWRRCAATVRFVAVPHAVEAPETSAAGPTTCLCSPAEPTGASDVALGAASGVYVAGGTVSAAFRQPRRDERDVHGLDEERQLHTSLTISATYAGATRTATLAIAAPAASTDTASITRAPSTTLTTTSSG